MIWPRQQSEAAEFFNANNVGLLMEVTEALAKAKINIEAVCAYAWES